jgi:ArsR family transcriptional regulator
MRIYTEKLDEVFKALGDQTRIRIMRLLARRTLCVCQIVDALAEPQYKVSRHLGILKRAGLVADRREGTWMHYSLHPECHLAALAAVQTLAEGQPEGVFGEDEKRLAESKPRTCPPPAPLAPKGKRG